MSREQFASDMREAASQPGPEQETATVETLEVTKAHENEPPATVEADPKETSTLPDSEQETAPEPRGTKEWLAEAGINIKDLYEQKIPGTDITFGQAKDVAPDLADISRVKLDIEKRSDELIAEQTSSNQQVLAVMQRLAAKYGEQEVMQAAQVAEQDVEGNLTAQNQELLRFKPELSEPGAWQTAHDNMAQVGRIYGLDARTIAASGAGIRRAFLRLHTLESYLDTLRESVKPTKKGRTSPAKQPASRGTKTKSAQFNSARKNRFADHMRNAQE
jgi:hypothetical protein